jgi:hypothetical protein
MKYHDKMPTSNSRFASGGVTVLNSSDMLQLGFCAWLTVLFSENPPESKAANSNRQLYLTA